ncbi:hypothetical protein ACVW00_001119 [Marmoricola sp. URHA0025 HA25]
MVNAETTESTLASGSATWAPSSPIRSTGRPNALIRPAALRQATSEGSTACTRRTDSG